MHPTQDNSADQVTGFERQNDGLEFQSKCTGPQPIDALVSELAYVKPVTSLVTVKYLNLSV